MNPLTVRHLLLALADADADAVVMVAPEKRVTSVDVVSSQYSPAVWLETVERCPDCRGNGRLLEDREPSAGTIPCGRCDGEGWLS